MKEKLAALPQPDTYKIDHRLMVGYFIAFLLLLFSYLLTLSSNRQLTSQTKMVAHTYKVIGDMEFLLTTIVNAETGLRGYMNTGDSIFLEPFIKSRLIIDSAFNQIAYQTSDNNIQESKLPALKLLIDRKFAIMQNGLNAYNAGGKTITEAVKKSGYQGKNSMDSIRSTINEMQEFEKKLLGIRDKKVESSNTASNAIVIASLLLAFVFAAFGIVAFYKENQARKKANEQIKDYQQTLKDQIIELDEANKELVEMRRAEKFTSTGRIARIIAHEVRNPLTNMDLALNQIKMEVNTGEKPELDMLFDMITRNSQRINQLITDLLNATRFTELTHSKTSVNVLLDEALQLAMDRIQLDNVQMVRLYSDDICDIAVDVEKIKLAFLNLIINGIEAMKDSANRQLTILTKSHNNKCVVEISDTGIGMNKEALGKLFEPYYTTKLKGNGLGLTNTHNIILNHEGRISVNSTPGEGTKFIVEFNFAG